MWSPMSRLTSPNDCMPAIISGTTGLPEVATPRCCDNPQLAQAGSEEADRPVEPFHPAGDHQRAGGYPDAPMPLPDIRRADDVGHAGLVLQAQEDDAARGPRLLPVGNQPSHADNGAILRISQFGCRH